LSDDLLPEWEGSSHEKCWRLLKSFLEEYSNPLYYNASINRIFEIDADLTLPAWLTNYYLVYFNI
jgi:hypothetical protein